MTRIYVDKGSSDRVPLIRGHPRDPRYFFFETSQIMRSVAKWTAPALFAILIATAADSACADDFDERVAPLVAKKCLACHNATDKKGGLDLASAKAALIGGESGPAFVPKSLDESLIWEKVSQNEMPPKKPLAEEEKQILKRWIVAGAKWGTDPIDVFKYSSDARAGYDWWSLKPLSRPMPPAVSDGGWVRNAIDRFILAELEARGLQPAPEADKRTLIRRLSFDLLGLPPDPEDVAAFLADDAIDAYSRLVERLLESPHYGERWGRHWLDVVRFGESQGFERDRLRPNAWPYRDWVISALNADLAYDEFVRLQLAGDIMDPADPRATIATGFLVAAPWDEVGQMQQSAAMKAVVRQDELEDLIAVTGQTFLGLTVNCARCHDHKFDPVSQAEYYKLAAVFAGVRHGERETSPLDSAAGGGDRAAARRHQLADAERRLAQELEAIDAPVRERILAARTASGAPRVELPRPIARWGFDGDLRDAIGELHGTARGAARVEDGRLVLDGKESFVETAPLKADLAARTLEVWLTLEGLDQHGGGAITIQSTTGAVFDAIVFGEKEPGQWMTGSNGYSRTQSFHGPAETEADKAVVQIVIVYDSDRTIACYRNGKRYGAPYTAPALATFEAGKSQILFGLRHSPPESDRFLAGAIDRAAIYDKALSPDEVAALAGVPSDVVTEDRLLAKISPEDLHRRQKLVFELSRVRSEISLDAGRKVYAVAPGMPPPTFILDRGNPAQRREAALPGAIKSVSGASPDFGLDGDASDAERRRRLAEWITDRRNPLTPRVIANRLWHYHFGVGIVDTPNDFGFNGGRPSHPELLDWLACELINPTVVAGLGHRREQRWSEPLSATEDLPSPGRPAVVPSAGSGDPRRAVQNPPPWSLKHLHRLIVTSATYRQSSRSSANAAKVDAGNRYLWRKTPQRLEAEALRDTMLVVAGEMNPMVGGPGFHDFRTFTFNSQFYEPVDPVGYAFNRRTVYRTWVRSGRNEFLDVFDCPDPSTTAPRRAVTTTPLQALALLNNSFTLRMSERLAARAERDARDLDSQIARVYNLAFNRKPEPEELAGAKTFAATHGLPALCRVIFNTNEFLYVD